MKTSLLFSFCFVTIATFYVNNVAAECYAYTGPDGRSKECKKESGYNDYQWVTCGSNSYVRRHTNGRYQCLFGSYCTLNCMIEVYGKSSGNVKGSCRCRPGDIPPDVFSSASQMTVNMLACVFPLITSFFLSSF